MTTMGLVMVVTDEATDAGRRSNRAIIEAVAIHRLNCEGAWGRTQYESSLRPDCTYVTTHCDQCKSYIHFTIRSNGHKRLTRVVLYDLTPETAAGRGLVPETVACVEKELRAPGNWNTVPWPFSMPYPLYGDGDFMENPYRYREYRETRWYT